MRTSEEARERFAIYLPESVVTEVRVMAAQTRLSMSQIVEIALSRYLAEKKTEAA